MKKKLIKILAIETSCDETSASLCEAKFKSQNLNLKTLENINILSNIISSQVKIHAKYGGVFPEMASREHLKAILPVIQASLEESRIKNNESCIIHNSKFIIQNNIDYIAVTSGPGLIGSLLIGVETAKTLSYLNNIPFYPIHHLEGHIYSNFVRVNPKSEILNSKQIQNTNNQNSKYVSDFEFRNSNILPEFPLICLAVSGGHTSLVYMKNHLDYKIIGETLDDAAGEAFDKVAKLLKLGFPGGPAISALAEKFPIYNFQFPIKSQIQNSKIPKFNKNSCLAGRQVKLKTKNYNIHFPRPMIDSNDFDFSFSGLKTSVLYTVKKLPKPLSEKTKAIICKEFQDAVVDTLVSKTIKAAQKYKVKSILLGGGVASNSFLRQEFELRIKNEKLKTNFFVPEKDLCTDNAAMVGIAAAYKIALGKRPTPWYNVNADSNMSLVKSL